MPDSLLVAMEFEAVRLIFLTLCLLTMWKWGGNYIYIHIYLYVYIQRWLVPLSFQRKVVQGISQVP